MYDLDSGAVAALGILSCDQLAMIAAAAHRIDTPLARAIELAVYLPCEIQAICNAPIELIDPHARTFRLVDDHGNWNKVPVGPCTADVIDAAAGTRTSGPLIADEYDNPLVIDREADDYAVQSVAEVDGRTTAFGWDFGSLRLSHVFHLRAAGISWGTIRSRAGQQVGEYRFPLGAHARRRLIRKARQGEGYRTGLCDSMVFLKEHALAEEFPIAAGLTLDHGETWEPKS